ncbi:MAG: hypothetical protein IJF33_03760 [Clostridia bacterium]|nr:hypothetical protein [Clostridia bacterium]
MARSRRGKWREIISACLAVLFVAGAIAGVASIAGRKTRTIGGSAYAVGEIDSATGQYVNSTDAIYTKEMFECQGLTIEPDFESKAEYRVFFYNVDGIYLTCSETKSIASFEPSEVPIAAKYARVCIYPPHVDGDGLPVDDFKIRFYEVYGVADNLTVRVDKTQKFPTLAELATKQNRTELRAMLAGGTVTNEAAEEALNSKSPLYVKNVVYGGILSITTPQISLFASNSYVDNDEYDILILSVDDVQGVQLDFSNSTRVGHVGYFYNGTNEHGIYVHYEKIVESGSSKIFDFREDKCSYAIIVIPSDGSAKVIPYY